MTAEWAVLVTVLCITSTFLSLLFTATARTYKPIRAHRHRRKELQCISDRWTHMARRAETLTGTQCGR